MVAAQSRIGAAPDARLHSALNEWATTHADWLGLGETRDWPAAAAALARIDAGATPHVLAVADVLAQALRLESTDAALLRLKVCAHRS